MNASTQSRSVTRAFGAPLSAAILLLGLCFACGPADAKPRATAATAHTVQACAVRAGKHRGALRLIAAGRRCRHGERRIVWNVLGPSGTQGAPGSPGEKGSQGNAGAEGAAGVQGPPGAPGAVDQSLEELVEAQGEQIETLTDSLNTTTSLLQGVTHEQLTSAVDAGTKLNGIAASDIEGAITNADKLVGITGSELNGAITNAAKLSGITTTELNSAIATIPKVTALCTRTTALTNQANSLLTGLGGVSLGGLLPVGLELKIPSLPAPLTAFACP